MQDEVGRKRLLERRGEPLHQLVGKAPDETDRVRDEVAAPVVLETSRRRVERLEETVVHGHLCTGQRVEQGRLADVRVPGERHGRSLRLLPRLAPGRTLLAQLLEAALQHRDPPSREPTVGLQLALSGAAGPDPTADDSCSAAESFEVLPHAAHAREVVLELRELDLELALGAPRVLREDVEDQLRPVDNACCQRVFELPLLRRRQVVVDEERLGPHILERPRELGQLPLPDVASLVWPGPLLDDLAHGLDAGGPRQLAKFAQLLFGIDVRPQHGDDEAPLRLHGLSRVRLALPHG